MKGKAGMENKIKFSGSKLRQEEKHSTQPAAKKQEQVQEEENKKTQKAAPFPGFPTRGMINSETLGVGEVVQSELS